MVLSAFISDGYEEKAYIREAPNVHPEVRFTFRPITLDERSAFLRETNKKPAEFNLIACRVLREKIKSWSLEKEITPANIRQLRPPLFDKLVNIVFGDAASEEDPEWSNGEATDHSKLFLAADADNKTAGEVRESHDQGNS